VNPDTLLEFVIGQIEVDATVIADCPPTPL